MQNINKCRFICTMYERSLYAVASLRLPVFSLIFKSNECIIFSIHFTFYITSTIFFLMGS